MSRLSDSSVLALVLSPAGSIRMSWRLVSGMVLKSRLLTVALQSWHSLPSGLSSLRRLIDPGVLEVPFVPYDLEVSARSSERISVLVSSLHLSHRAQMHVCFLLLVFTLSKSRLLCCEVSRRNFCALVQELSFLSLGVTSGSLVVDRAV